MSVGLRERYQQFEIRFVSLSPSMMCSEILIDWDKKGLNGEALLTSESLRWKTAASLSSGVWNVDV